MSPRKHLQEIQRADLLPLFKQIDSYLRDQGRHVCVTTLGGVSILHYDFRSRATGDIDIAPIRPDSDYFVEACKALGIDAQIVTQTSTIDFQDVATEVIFEGDILTIKSIKPRELLQSKLERFTKQDPEDIYAIISAIEFTYDDFKSLFQNMLPDFIGNERTLQLNALNVVEQMYSEQTSDFEKILKRQSSDAHFP